jgi:hypothetical protein
MSPFTSFELRNFLPSCIQNENTECVCGDHNLGCDLSACNRLKLGYEEKSVGLNRAKITDQWRNILRKAKTVDLRRDVVTLKVGSYKPLN